MTATVATPVGLAHGRLYPADMAQGVFMGVEAARRVLGTRVKKAKDEGELTVLTVHGQPEAVVVPMAWFNRAAECIGDPIAIATPAATPTTPAAES